MDSRIEKLLEVLVNGGDLPDDYRPESRIEAYLYVLIQNSKNNGSPLETFTLTDSVTGALYKLSVNNGNLTMTEVK